MNKRIRELALQATDEILGVKILDQKKFAELIVRECVGQGRQVQSQKVINGSQEYIAGREAGIEVFINQIMNHFGVNS